MYNLCCAVVLSLVPICFCDDSPPPTCDSNIYCHGPLLDTIQRAKIHQDSKTFVDMKLKLSPSETFKKFNEFMEKNNNKPSKAAVGNFLKEHFDPDGQEFENWEPGDWVKRPKFIDSIRDEKLKEWALKLNAIWKNLGRKLKDEVKRNQELYSIIWVPNPVVVPGGRFREYYYWDSYWIVQGLLLCEMYDTVKGILENFLYIVDKYNHIPNGGRIYYLHRSQPPLMIPMIKSFYDFTQDREFIKKNINLIEKEFEFWITKHNRTVNVGGVDYTLAIYADNSKGPRPESYSEDVTSAQTLGSDEKKESLYSELKAAAESGWDFSSRWFIKSRTNKGDLTNTKVHSIVPVDLNAMLCQNAVLLSEFNDLLGNREKVEYYNKLAKKWMEAITAVLWHEEVGAWLDYDISNKVKRDYFHCSNIAPLWTGCYNQNEKGKIVPLVLKYLQKKKVTSYPGGIPSTLEDTGEQWDYPNAWPPLQHIMVIGLNNTLDERAQKVAFEIADKWVRCNYESFKETGFMFEKYDATLPGGLGHGGEYKNQLGFGWSNGVILDFLYRYGDKLRADTTNRTSSSFSPISPMLLALIISSISFNFQKL